MNITVSFKSVQKIYEKEKSGKKPNTVRKFEDSDVRFQCEPTHIKIRKKGSREWFKRELTDVTYWNGLVIYSWRHS